MSELKKKILETVIDEDPSYTSLRFEAADLLVIAMLGFMVGALWLMGK